MAEEQTKPVVAPKVYPDNTVLPTKVGKTRNTESSHFDKVTYQANLEPKEEKVNLEPKKEVKEEVKIPQ